jgi:hypothetical protein
MGKTPENIGKNEDIIDIATRAQSRMEMIDTLDFLGH